MKRLRIYVLGGMLLLASPFAQAGIIEDLLALPAIQSLLGRVGELPNLVRNCQDAGYKQRNLAFCQQAEQAALLARMPPELRIVMARPESAQSLRDLCLAALGKPAYDSFLCAELVKYDKGFLEQSKQLQWQQLMDRQMR